MARERSRRPADQEGKATVEIEVRDVSDRIASGAQVTLAPFPRGPAVALEYDKRTSYYRGVVAPGRYTASVTRRGSERQERRMDVPLAGAREAFILGLPGMPFYYRGRVQMPFEPRPELIGVLLRSARPAGDTELDDLGRALDLEPVDLPDEIRRARGRLFRLPEEVSDERRQVVIQRLGELPGVEHAGSVVGLRDRSLSLLTDELVVRFEEHVTEKDVRKLGAEFRLEMLRSVGYAPNTWHFRAQEAPGYRVLDITARLAALDAVDWAEPNLVTTAEVDAVIPTDFLWNGVWDRQLVGCPDAWQALQDAGLQPFGEPTVIIAVVDEGIESAGGVPTLSEFQGTVSNGATKTYRLFDFSNLVPNNDKPVNNHGMLVAGVCGARADNPSPVAGVGEGLAGAAPNCRLMGLIYPVSDVDKADMYIWAAGFNPHSSRAHFPAPINPGADVFTTCVGFGNGAPIAGTAAAMLDYLTTHGRGGKGCLCFFSTGNENANIFPIDRPWAAYKHSIAIAASTLDVDGVSEIRAPDSGWGSNIQLCAPSSRGLQHNPPAAYRTLSCDFPGQGSLIGHPVVQTVLTAAAKAGDTVLQVVSVVGFVAGGALLLEQPGKAGWEPAAITGTPNGVTNQIPVAAVLNAHVAGTPVSTGPTGYRRFGGTSSATPLTAGVAALVLSANPNLTWIDLLQLLRASAEKINPGTTELHSTDPAGDFRWRDANGDPSVVSGLPPVWSIGYGFGRVDAVAAVQDALG